MKRVASLAGPAAALIALKCPFCYLALAGVAVGGASFTPWVTGAYWLVILALGALFLWFMARSWKSDLLSSWVFSLGAAGFGGLIYQAAAEPEGFLSFIPGALITVSGILSFSQTRIEAGSSCCPQKPQNDLNEQGGSKHMATKRKIEVFTSGCPLCEPVVDLVKKTACSSCEVVVYDLNAGCDTNECRTKAKQYGVTRAPSVVVDGKLLDCCNTGTVTEQELRAAGVGSP